MAVAHVQFASQRNDTAANPGTVTVTLGSAPTAGNLLLFLAAIDDENPDEFLTPSGFTKLDSQYASTLGMVASNGDLRAGFQVFYRVVESGDGTSYTATHQWSGATFGAIVEVSGAGTPVVRSAPFSSTTGVFFTGQDATVQSTSYAFMAAYSDYRGSSWSVTTPTGFTELLDSANSTQALWCGYDIGATTISDLSVSNGGTPLCGMLVEVPESGTTLTPWDGANFVKVAPSGGNYTTFSAAIADLDIRNGVYQTQWASNTACTETIYAQSLYTSSTKSSFSFKRHLHITAAPANRHSGVYGTGHARINAGIYVQTLADWTRISHLQIENSAECVVMYYSNNLLLDNLILKAGSTTRLVKLHADQNEHNSIHQCVMHANTSNKIALEPSDNSQPGETWVTHCSIDGRFGNNSDYVKIWTYNNWWRPTFANNYAIDNGGRTNGLSARGAGNVHDSNYGFVEPAYEDFATLHNIKLPRSGNSLTTTTTGTQAIIVTNTSDDFTPKAATGSGSNPILTTGVSTDDIGHYDPRIDFSYDIAGNARPTTNVDVGAFQITAGPAAAATGTGIQVYTGSEWVNANAIQYYDGEWT